MAEPASLHDPAEDQEILRGLAVAKPEAFHRFFEAWFPKVYAYALRELASRPLAEAVTRRTLRRALGELPDALAREADVAGWLLGLVKSEVAFARRPTAP